MRVGVLPVLLSLIAVGCSATDRNQSPIVGNWTLDAARTAAASDPDMANRISGSMTFLSDGRCRCSTTFRGYPTDEAWGKWRLVGNDLYVLPQGGEREAHINLRGNDLIDYRQMIVPGAVIYTEPRNWCGSLGKTIQKFSFNLRPSAVKDELPALNIPRRQK